MPRKDKLPPGLILRGKTYWVDFRQKDVRIRQSLNTGDKHVAEVLLTELRSRANKGDYGLLDNDFSIEALKARYLEHCEQTLKSASVRRYRAALAAIIPSLPLRVSQLTVESILIYRKERLASVAPRVVNYEVARLQGMLRWGVKPARLIGANPIAELTPLREENKTEKRALTPEEVGRLLDVAREPWRSIWYAFLTTGMRTAEL